MEDNQNDSVKYLESFLNIDKVKDIFNELKTLENESEPLLKSELILQNFSTIFDNYLDQPHLIDPYLKDLSDFLISIIKTNISNQITFQVSLKLFYHLTKVRGFKVILRYLPCNYEEVKLVLNLLNQNENFSWESKYVLLLWLSVLALIPFNLERLDDNKNDLNLMDQFYQVITNELLNSSKSSDAAAYLAAKFLTRPETKDVFLSKFINWSIDLLDNYDGPLLALSYVFKMSDRKDVQHFGKKLFLKLSENENLKKNDHKYKLAVKLIQRIALSYLKIKVCDWRYQRGRRFLAQNLEEKLDFNSLNKNDGSSNIHDNSSKKSLSYSENDELMEENFLELDEEKLEELTSFVSFFLNSLKHKNMDVRYSASKAIGRITERLTKDFAEDIIENILELFNQYEEESILHGACLSIAELARRGLILPDKLPELIPLISKALIYEELKGNFTTGKIVRDAACYVCWAFARAFDPNIIRPFVESLATTLIIVAVYDKEVMIRRAAAAAFQENVGRQGTFPNGIDIVTTVDHFSIQLINKAYLEVGPQVAKFEKYKLPLIDHLINNKIKHSDFKIRELAADSLFQISLELEKEIILDYLIPKILKLTESSNFKERHGAILALASLIKSLGLNSHNFSEKLLNEIENLFFDLLKKTKLAELSGDLMRHALCILLENCSLSKINFNKKDDLIELWIDFLKKTIVHTDLNLRKHALNAFKPFCDYYLNKLRIKQDEILSFLILEVKNGNEHNKISCLTALSDLPESIFEPDTPSILITTVLSLLKNGCLNNKTLANVRSKAIKCIKMIILSLDKFKLFGIRDIIEEFLNFCIDEGTNDFTVYSMKDIGILVREESIISLTEITLDFLKNNVHKSLIEQYFVKTICSILPSCVCPNDNLRNKSTTYFYKLINEFKPNEDLIKICQLFDNVNRDQEMQDNSKNFELFVQLLDFDVFRNDLLKGLVLTTGGFEYSSVNHSREALVNYLKKACLDKPLYEKIQLSLFKLFSENKDNNRYPITIIKTYNYLFSTGIMDTLNLNLLNDILNGVWTQIKKSDDVKKISEGSILICSLIKYEDLQKSCLTKIMILLCSKFPNVRSKTADTFYVNLLIYGDSLCNDENKLEEVMKLLSETNWSNSSLIDLKNVRKIICKNLDIPEPVPIKKN